MNKITFLIFSFLFLQVYSQEGPLYQSLIISDELKENANAVIRLNEIYITIESYDKMIYSNKRVVTVLNERGSSKVGAYVGYDNNTTVKKLQALVYDVNGKEIKKFKKRDFLDESAVSGGTLYSDSRVKYLNYIPIKYPYTVEFYTEVEYRSTAFIPNWEPLEGFYVSTENSSYILDNKSNIELKIKASNFDGFNIIKDSRLSYSAKRLKAINSESYSPNFEEYVPNVKAALVDFNMEGVRGSNTNWKDFGRWINESLLADTQNIPESVKQEVVALTKDAETALEKAKIVYEYMQSKTRYISVQIGIGGWKPMLAKDVSKLGYSDCKGLTNFTKALLKEVGVESYYTVLYAGDNIRDIDRDFSATQGNHAILCLPNNDDYIWLECTSQTVPFGYTANFTDDRDVLIIKPEGGEIVHTKKYESIGNKQITTSKIYFTETGGFKAKVSIESYGSQYGQHERIQRKSKKDQKMHYKNYWNHINNLDVNLVTFENDKNAIVFSEAIDVEVEKYASNAGDRLLLNPNFFNISEIIPKEYSYRTLPIKIDRGFLDIDEYEIDIPESLIVESLFKPIRVSTQFGDYSCSITHENNKLIYKREFLVNEGLYQKEEYEAFREFLLQVAKNDNLKIVLKLK